MSSLRDVKSVAEVASRHSGILLRAPQFAEQGVGTC